MKINGIDLSTFNAKLVGRTLESSETLVDNEWSEKSLLPFIGDSEYKYKKLRLDVEFKGNFGVTNLNKSKLLKELTICSISEIGLGANTLSGFVVSHSIKVENNLYHRVEYELNVLEEMEQVNKLFMNGNEVTPYPYTLDNPGTGVSPAEVEVIAPTEGKVELILNGSTFTLNNMKANTPRKISVEAGVFEGATNKFDDTIFKEFPKIKSGSNTIKVTPENTQIKITYKPRII